MKTSVKKLLVIVAISFGLLSFGECDKFGGGNDLEWLNTPPVAFDKSVTTPAENPVKIKLKAKDKDHQKLTYTVDRKPAYGVLPARKIETGGLSHIKFIFLFFF